MPSAVASLTDHFMAHSSLAKHASLRAKDVMNLNWYVPAGFVIPAWKSTRTIFHSWKNNFSCSENSKSIEQIFFQTFPPPLDLEQAQDTSSQRGTYEESYLKTLKKEIQNENSMCAITKEKCVPYIWAVFKVKTINTYACRVWENIFADIQRHNK